MRIAIAGAGVAGGYIWRLLKAAGIGHVDIYDRRHSIACGIHPCGYGVDERYNGLVEIAGLTPASYVRHDPPRLLAEVAGVRAETSVFMIDKPRLIADLLDGAKVIYDRVDVGGYELVIDATGEARCPNPFIGTGLPKHCARTRLGGRRGSGAGGPASGAGNVYAMESSLDLVGNLGDAAGYVAALRRRFSQLVPEARAVRRVLLGRLPAPADAYHIRQGWSRAGVRVAWRDLPRLMVAMKRAFAGVEAGEVRQLSAESSAPSQAFG